MQALPSLFSLRVQERFGHFGHSFVVLKKIFTAMQVPLDTLHLALIIIVLGHNLRDLARWSSRRSTPRCRHFPLSLLVFP